MTEKRISTPERLEQWRRYGAKRRAQAGYRGRARKWEMAYEQRTKSKPEKMARKAANMKRYRNDPRHRAKHEARWILNHAIASGRIVSQPCSNCTTIPAQAHHADYSKPLDIIWLCRACHQHEHARATGKEDK